jgi:hypothetical protein
MNEPAKSSNRTGIGPFSGSLNAHVACTASWASLQGLFSAKSRLLYAARSALSLDLGLGLGLAGRAVLFAVLYRTF